MASSSRPPLPEPIFEALVAVAFGLAVASQGSQRLLWTGAVLSFWMTFEGILQPRECTSLQRKHIVLAGDFGESLATRAVLTIMLPKNRRPFA